MPSGCRSKSRLCDPSPVSSVRVLLADPRQLGPVGPSADPSRQVAEVRVKHSGVRFKMVEILPRCNPSAFLFELFPGLRREMMVRHPQHPQPRRWIRQHDAEGMVFQGPSLLWQVLQGRCAMVIKTLTTGFSTCTGEGSPKNSRMTEDYAVSFRRSAKPLFSRASVFASIKRESIKL